jgi:hypothetical protein
LAAGLRMVRRIVRQVAPLAPRPQILLITVFRGVVKMCDCQDDAATGDWVGLAVDSTALGIPRAALAAAASTGEDGRANLRQPVLGIALPVLGTNRHQTSPLRY